MGSPFLLWRQQGFTVDLASVQGGEIPWDQASLEGDFFTPEAQAFMSDGECAATAQRHHVEVSRLRWWRHLLSH